MDISLLAQEMKTRHGRQHVNVMCQCPSPGVTFLLGLAHDVANVSDAC